MELTEKSNETEEKLSEINTDIEQIYTNNSMNKMMMKQNKEKLAELEAELETLKGMKAVPNGGGSLEGLPELMKKYATTE
jgi:TolA-binding protein